jgi:hypothetical protein
MRLQSWLTDVLKRMVSGRTKANQLERLLPWTWEAERVAAAVYAHAMTGNDACKDPAGQGSPVGDD